MNVYDFPSHVIDYYIHQNKPLVQEKPTLFQRFQSFLDKRKQAKAKKASKKSKIPVPKISTPSADTTEKLTIPAPTSKPMDSMSAPVVPLPKATAARPPTDSIPTRKPPSRSVKQQPAQAMNQMAKSSPMPLLGLVIKLYTPREVHFWYIPMLRSLSLEKDSPLTSKIG